ncbi:hypothetical protein DJ031_15375 [bacterium endosymbiont of Escarpia laminata]|nr:MAG: hypothetical protein DJ031_15375 [bacterium endosymbiont of Escarpia laminata]
MGSVVNLIGRGGQCFAEEILGWNRVTVRKGQTELRSGTTFENRFSARGRRRIEECLPHLLDDIRSIVEPSGQTDPTFRSTRIYSPLSADEVRLRLIAQRGYSDTELPCTRTLRNKLNDLGYQLRKVRKCLPLKKIPETDAIFKEVHQVNRKRLINNRLAQQILIRSLSRLPGNSASIASTVSAFGSSVNR